MQPKHRLTFHSASPSATHQIAQALAPFWQVGDVVLLSGELGAGKTEFMKGVAQGLAIDSPVTSPTFALSHHYSIAETGAARPWPGKLSQSGESGRSSQPGESGRLSQPGESGRLSQPGESGRSSQPSEPGRSSQPQLRELRHLDLYRLDDPAEMLDYIWEELAVAAVFVEWGDRLPAELFDSYLEVKFQFAALGEANVSLAMPDTRVIDLLAVGNRWHQVWSRLEAATSQLPRA